MNQLKQIVTPLCSWYDASHRMLPWRLDATPYHVWISEIMLQQTRVEAVIGYYNRFISRLPDIESLSKVDDEVLLKLWEGLGYYSRVRNLKKSAMIVMDQYDGMLPSNYDELLKLPGIGDYTAGAIASIAYQKRVPAVDGNVLRVITRVSMNSDCIDDMKTKKKMQEQLTEIMPVKSGTFNQALMELGATVCLPNGIPLCLECPINKYCKAMDNQVQLNYPVRKAKKKRRMEDKTVFIILSQQQVQIKKRKEDGLLAHFYEFPNVEGFLSLEEAKSYLKETGIELISIQEGPSAKHIFTHIEWHMKSYIVVTTDNKNKGDIYATTQELEHTYPLPTAFAKYKQYVFKYCLEADKLPQFGFQSSVKQIVKGNKN